MRMHCGSELLITFQPAFMSLAYNSIFTIAQRTKKRKKKKSPLIVFLRSPSVSCYACILFMHPILPHLQTPLLSFGKSKQETKLFSHLKKTPARGFCFAVYLCEGLSFLFSSSLFFFLPYYPSSRQALKNISFFSNFCVIFLLCHRQLMMIIHEYRITELKWWLWSVWSRLQPMQELDVGNIIFRGNKPDEGSGLRTTLSKCVLLHDRGKDGHGLLIWYN